MVRFNSAKYKEISTQKKILSTNKMLTHQTHQVTHLTPNGVPQKILKILLCPLKLAFPFLGRALRLPGRLQNYIKHTVLIQTKSEKSQSLQSASNKKFVNTPQKFHASCLEAHISLIFALKTLIPTV